VESQHLDVMFIVIQLEMLPSKNFSQLYNNSKAYNTS